MEFQCQLKGKMNEQSRDGREGIEEEKHHRKGKGKGKGKVKGQWNVRLNLGFALLREENYIS